MSFPSVDIDASGVFKYVLIRATSAEGERWVVAGHVTGAFHADVFEAFQDKYGQAGVTFEVHGGGRIAHDASAKELKVYGYSVGFGRADHAVSRDVLAAEYPGYTITISDEGY